MARAWVPSLPPHRDCGGSQRRRTPAAPIAASRTPYTQDRLAHEKTACEEQLEYFDLADDRHCRDRLNHVRIRSGEGYRTLTRLGVVGKHAVCISATLVLVVLEEVREVVLEEWFGVSESPAAACRAVARGGGRRGDVCGAPLWAMSVVR